MSSTVTSYYLRYRVKGSTEWIIFGEPETDFTEVLQGLQPNSTYEIEVVASNDYGQTTSSTIEYVTAARAPGAPGGLSATSVTTTSLVLNWNQSPSGSPPITYQVFYRVHNQPSYVAYGSTVSSTSLPITGLNASTTYDFQVTATNLAGSANSQPLTISTLATGQTPSAPINLAFTNVGQSQLTVTWTPSTGTAPINYAVQYRVHGGTTFTGAGSTNTSSLTLTNLTQATTYDILVTASNLFGSASSQIGLATTAAAPIAPSQPGAPTGSNVTASGLTLSWAASATGTAPISYQVQFRLNGQTPAANYSNFGAPVAATVQSVTGLAAGTLYDFRIVASNAGGSATGATLTISTASAIAAPAAPTGLFTTNITSTNLTLGWQASATGTQPITYQPQFRITGQPTFNNIGTPLSVLTVPVQNLTASTSYDFRIIATNAAGTATSATLTVSTPAAGTAPTAPVITVGTPTSTTLPITWTASTGTGGITYTPQYRVTGSAASFTTIASTTTLAATITGLVTGTQYDIQVIAANGFGSTTSATVTGTTALVESASGTLLTTSQGVIVDHDLTQWRLNGTPRTSATVQMNTGSGWVSTGSTTTAVQVLYWATVVYYQDNTTGWFSWNGSAWVAAAGDPRVGQESAQGTTLTSTTGQIVDGSAHVWTLVVGTTGFQYAKDGTADSRTHNIVLGLYWNHTVWYEDNTNLWYSYNAGTDVWSTGQTQDPRTGVANESTNGTVLTTTTGQIIDANQAAWTLVTSPSSGLQVAKAGVVDKNTTNATTLLYWNHTVYFQNASGTWFQYDGTKAYPWILTVDPRASGATPLFFDDFNTLSMVNTRDSSTTNNNWFPCFTWSSDGFVQNDSWNTNPFNPDTPFTELYQITQASSSLTPTFSDTFSTFSVYNNYYIQPGVGFFFANGIEYKIDSSGNMLGNGTPLSGGDGTGAAAYYQGTIYAQDGASGNWYTWNGSTFTGPVTAPPSTFLTPGGTWRYISFEESAATQNGSNLTDDGATGSWMLNPLYSLTPITGVYVLDSATGRLNLGLVSTPTQYRANAGNNPYCGALLSSDRTITQLFGYWEITVAVDRLIGFGAEVAIENHHIGWPPEIDLVHIFTDANGIQHQTFVVFEGTFPNETRQEWTQSTATGFDPSQTHTYGLLWKSDFLTFYVDRVQVWQIPTSANYKTNPLYMYLVTFQHYYQFGDAATDAPVIANPAALPVYARFDAIQIWNDLPFTGGAGSGSSDLVLTCEATPPGHTVATQSKPQVAAFMNTQTSFNRQYGYFEAEMVIPLVPGTNGAFLLYSNDQYPPEIDIQEWASGANSDGTQWQVGSTTIFNTDVQNPQAVNHIYSYELGYPFDISGRHTYGVLVDPTHLTVYWDRLQVAQWPMPAGYNFPLFMVLSVGSGGGWSGSIPAALPTATPGVGSFVDTFGNTWSVNGSGNPVVNGGTDTNSHVIQIWRYNNTIWQEDLTGTFYNALITGSGQNAASIPWTGPFTLGPAQNILPLEVNVGYCGAWQSLPFTSPSSANITDIQLSATSVASTAPAGTLVGTVTVIMSDGNTFGGTLTLAGADSSSFNLLAGRLTTVGTLVGGTTDSITLTAAIGSKSLQKSFTITITGTGGGTGGTGPTASSSFITVAFASAFPYPGGTGQQIVSQKLYGVYIGYGGDPGNQISTLGTRGPDPNSFSAYTYSAFTTAMAIVNPGLHVVTGNLAFNGTSNFFNMSDPNNPTVNPVAFANLINNFYRVDPLGISSILFGLNFGDFPSTTAYGIAQGAVASYMFNNGAGRLMPNGKQLPVIGFIGHNEPDGTYSASQSSGYYSAMQTRIKAVNPNYVSLGPITSFYQGSYTKTFLQGVRTDGVSWDYFNAPGGGTTSLGSQVYLSDSFAKSFSPGISDLMANELPSGYKPTAIMAAGNIGWQGAVPDQLTVNGAMFLAVNFFNGLSVSPVPLWNGVWDDGAQGTNGIINVDPFNSSSTPRVSPMGYLLGAAVRTVFGPRWNVTTNAAGLMVIACTPPGVHFGVMIVNPGKGAQNSKTVALSNWPINATGNATANVWQMTSAVQAPGQDGTRTTINVTAGVTAPMNFPDPSVTIIWI